MTEASNVEGQDIATAPEEIKGDKVDLIYENHGGNPSNLDLTRCLIVSSLPSSFLNDSYDIFRDCIVDLLAETFKIQPDVIDAIIRIPSLQKDAATQENALRAIVSFKNRVHKHRVFAQKKHAEESTFHVDGIEKIPEEFLKIKEESAEEEREEAATEHEYLADEEEEEEPVVEEDHVHEDELLQEDEEEHSGDDEDAGFEMADEVGEDELGEEEEEHEKEEEPKEQVDQEEDSKKESVKTEEAEKKKKKVYIDEDDNAPFVVSWEGAPEFQWRVPSDYADTRRLIIENVQWGDLRDVFIYRAMIKAENVDIQFPMRYNLDGTRPFYGKLTLLYDFNGQLLGEVIKHLIYFRSTDSHRRIKIFLPQVPKAVKRKEELELKLGHLIKPTPRMFQLIVKVLPAGYEPTLDDACAWFPSQSVTDVQLENDELNQPCAIVTF
ncbi:unnamed protein product [Caenorhabditis auriculariae]|uniref:Uncharacterized protein n=1 Tax=Caenorhabditis auriculariae TaxID=2777116 RepID=A0A8S1HK95_9PELO|nr:unnamed protein product [Caenorhabditis auriculariae]